LSTVIDQRISDPYYTNSSNNITASGGIGNSQTFTLTKPTNINKIRAWISTYSSAITSRFAIFVSGQENISYAEKLETVNTFSGTTLNEVEYSLQEAKNQSNVPNNGGNGTLLPAGTYVVKWIVNYAINGQGGNTRMTNANTPQTFHYQLLGTTSGGGSGFDGGVINQPLEIKRATLLGIDKIGTSSIPNLRQWLYAAPDAANPADKWPAYISAPSPGLGLRFAENNGDWTDMYPIKTDEGVGIAVNHHFFVRKDFATRGFLNTYEGAICLHGNGPNAGGPNNPNDRWNIGWGPRRGTPFIWLAEGGDRRLNIMGGNSGAETLLIVTNNAPSKPAPSGNIPGNAGRDKDCYRWGHLECGNLIVHGTSNIAGGNSSIKSGQATTDSDGTKTIPFPTGTFTTTPIITVTVVDTSNNNNQAYTAKIVSATKDSFKVKILSSKHRHQLGYTAGNSDNKTLFHATSSNSGTQSDSNYVFMPYTPLYLYRSDGESNLLAAGLLPSTQTGIAGQDWFTKVEDGTNTVGGVVFNWIAIPPT
jgi:hypothetical protein